MDRNYFKSHQQLKFWSGYQADLATGRERKEDSNPCVTSVTVIVFEITLCQTSLSFKQMFLQRPETLMLQCK